MKPNFSKFAVWSVLLSMVASGPSRSPAQDLGVNANGNPSTAPAPQAPPDHDKPSSDDADEKGDDAPLGPGPLLPEGLASCEVRRDPDEPKPDHGLPPFPGSVDIEFPLVAYPFELSINQGGLRLYIEKAEANMGDAGLLKYHFVGGAVISDQETTNLPPGVEKRFTVVQASGKPISYDKFVGQSILIPSGSNSASRSRAELRTASGVTSDPADATIFRQYRSAGGYMDLDIATGEVLNWSRPTGGGKILGGIGADSAAPDIIKQGGKIRQVKTQAGALDIIADSDGRGYSVVTYLPDQVSLKVGELYTFVAGARPKRTVHITHPVGTQQLIGTFTDHSPGSGTDKIRVITYTYSDPMDGGHEWEMKTESEGAIRFSSRKVIPDHDREGMRRVVREVKDGSGKLLVRREVVQQYEKAWNGWTDVRTTDVPGGDIALRRVQNMRYGTTAGQNDFRKLIWQSMSNGQVFEYKYDNQQRMVERRSQWLDGTDGKFLIEKFDYTPHVGGEIVAAGDERPRTTTVEVGTPGAGDNPVISKSYFSAFDDPANGGRHTVVTEIAANPGSAYGSGGNRRNKQVFQSAAESDFGRLIESVDEYGLRTQWSYEDLPGGGIAETTTGPLDSAGAAKEGFTKRIRNEKSADNRLIKSHLSLFSGTDYVGISEDLHSYFPEGNLQQITRTDLKSSRQRVLSSFQWKGENLQSMSVIGEMPISYTYDGFDRIVTTTSGGAPLATSPVSGVELGARPSITSALSGGNVGNLETTLWGDRSITNSALSLSSQLLIKTDAAGRIIERTDADGYMMATAYSADGLRTDVTLPDGGMVSIRRYISGFQQDKTGTSVVPEYYSYSVNPDGHLTATTRWGRADSPRFRSVTKDNLGRLLTVVEPGHGGILTTTFHYEGAGSRISKIVSSAPQTPIKLIQYDPFGEVVRQGETVRPSASVLDISSVDDRVMDLESSLLQDASGIWVVRKIFVYPHEGASVSNRQVFSESRSKQAGFTGDETRIDHQIDASSNWTKETETKQASSLITVVSRTSNLYGGSNSDVFHGGKLVESRRAGDTNSARTSYDALGRAIADQDARHANAGQLSYAGSGERVESTIDASGAVTSYSYHPSGTSGAGRVSSITTADGKVRRFAYDLRGNVVRTWGSGSPPLAFEYDVYNQRTSLSTYRATVGIDSETWPSSLGAVDKTEWIMEESTGLLLQKLDADNKGSAYSYDLAGRLIQRTSARNRVTNYTYTDWGQADAIIYDDSTPDVDRDYDRMGRMILATNGVATSIIEYSSTHFQPLSETIEYDLNTDGTPDLTRVIEKTYDSFQRPSGYRLKAGSFLESEVEYGYDAQGRIGSVDAGAAGVFTYGYVPNSDLIQSVTSPVHLTEKVWETNRDLLDSVTNSNSGGTISNFDYTVDVMGRRSALSQYGSAFLSSRSIAFSYDAIGQVISADSDVSGHDRIYEYDAMGNREKSSDSLTLPLLKNYTANSLNQYTAIGTTEPQYDLDGNAVSYPLPSSPGTSSVLEWDSENRLISSTTGSITTDYQYDFMGRRVAKTGVGSQTVYVYDGWDQVADYTPGAGSPSSLGLKSGYVWGLDLSGSRSGAGGSGGLLAVSRKTGSSVDHFYPTYDGNGNVSEYLSSSGAVAAHFEYDPFGRIAVDTDSSRHFDFRFSTRIQDSESGLYYYGYRSLDPLNGRWLSRDPIGEEGGVNLYAFLSNDGLDNVDLLGLSTIGESNRTWAWWNGAAAPVARKAGEGAILGGLLTLFGELFYNLGAYDTLPSCLQDDYEYHHYPLKDYVEGAAWGAAFNLGGYGIQGLAQKFIASPIGQQLRQSLRNLGGAFRNAVRTPKPTQLTDVSPKPGVDLTLKYKAGWTDAQRAAADGKAAALTRADTVVTRSPVRIGTAQSRYRKEQGLGRDVDADHTVDLQLGGADDILNISSLDSSVNRSLGSQINKLIKSLPEGTRINNVRIVDP